MSNYSAIDSRSHFDHFFDNCYLYRQSFTTLQSTIEQSSIRTFLTLPCFYIEMRLTRRTNIHSRSHTFRRIIDTNHQTNRTSLTYQQRSIEPGFWRRTIYSLTWSTSSIQETMNPTSVALKSNRVVQLPRFYRTRLTHKIMIDQQNLTQTSFASTCSSIKHLPRRTRITSRSTQIVNWVLNLNKLNLLGGKSISN